eukprot:CAMPEP_0206008936 /NCGR_PEP_ID=MMETSP1464-20131121/8576_1 /ASSEMBLY_ACC=CAM_ASM_001124 /TAXON_ID=119497 /ORGANISM="Exanthemachrysis gayraliae, Strain RCC1523" /LENGTH=634 /DNA_ID=CAMNT_0053382505 /DNA_START=19 /DNA_END=1920 /DNA_ORIENTATION=+
MSRMAELEALLSSDAYKSMTNYTKGNIGEEISGLFFERMGLVSLGRTQMGTHGFDAVYIDPHDGSICIIEVKVSGTAKYAHQVRMNHYKKWDDTQGSESWVRRVSDKMAQWGERKANQEMLNAVQPIKDALDTKSTAIGVFGFIIVRDKATGKLETDLRDVFWQPAANGGGGGGGGGPGSGSDGQQQQQQPVAEAVQRVEAECKGLISTDASSHEGGATPSVLDGAGDIGGVRVAPGPVPAVMDALDDSGALVIAVKLGAHGGALLTNAAVQQVLHEVYDAVYVAGRYPWFSLHFNRARALVPVMPPEYRGTLVGHVIAWADYFLKGFVNGGYYAPEDLRADFLPAPRDVQQELAPVDARDYRALHELLPALPEAQGAERVEGAARRDAMFFSACRIIMQAPPRVSSGIVSAGTDFTVECDIGESPAYLGATHAAHKALEDASAAFAGAPDADAAAAAVAAAAQSSVVLVEDKELRDAFEACRLNVERRMAKHPRFEQYFVMLGLIQAVSSVWKTLKDQGREPVLPARRPRERWALPDVFPALPVREAARRAECTLSWADVRLLGHPEVAACRAALACAWAHMRARELVGEYGRDADMDKVRDTILRQLPPAHRMHLREEQRALSFLNTGLGRR